MALTQIRYTRTYYDATGKPAVGATPVFRLSQTAANGTSTVVPTNITCTVDSQGRLCGPDGIPGVVLDALDDAGTTPTGCYYTVTGEPGGVPWTFVAYAADSPTKDLASKAPATPGNPVYSYALESWVEGLLDVEPWEATSAITFRQLGQGTNGMLVQCTTAGTTGSTEPTWPSPGQTVTDGTVVWTVLAGGVGATETWVEQLINAATWSASGAITVRQLVQGTNGTVAQCTTAGTTGSSEPAWPTTPGSSVTDGTVTWKVLSVGSGAYVAMGSSNTAVAAATTNQALTGLPTIDGVTVTDGQTVLLTGQSTGSQNGPWVAHTGAWTRPSWWASGSNQLSGSVLVTGGTTYAASGWGMQGDLLQDGTSPVTVDTTAESWVQTAKAVSQQIGGSWRMSIAGSGSPAPTNIPAFAIEISDHDPLGVFVIQPSHSTHAFGGINLASGFRYTHDWYTNSAGEQEYSISNNGAYAPTGVTGRTFVDGSLTAGSGTLTSAGAANFTAQDVGREVTGPGIAASRAITDGVTTSGSNVLTSATANFTARDIGRALNETDAQGAIPANTYVYSVTNSTTVVMTQTAAGAFTGIALSIVPDKTYVSAYVSATQVTLSLAADATESAQSYTLSPSPTPGALSLAVQDNDRLLIHQFGQLVMYAPANRTNSSADQIPVNQPTLNIHTYASHFSGQYVLQWYDDGYNQSTPLGGIGVNGQGAAWIGTLAAQSFSVLSNNTTVATFSAAVSGATARFVLAAATTAGLPTALINATGTVGPALDLKTTSWGAYALRIWNSSYSTSSPGLQLASDNSGNGIINGAVNLELLTAGATRLTLAAGSMTLADATNIAVGATTGTKIGTAGGAAGQKLGFYNATPVVQPLLATGASHTVDDVITTLQTLGLVRQS